MLNANRRVERTITCFLEERREVSMRQKWTVQEISGPQLLFIRSGCLFDVSYKVHTSPQHQLNLVNKPADMRGIEHERILLSAITYFSKVRPLVAVGCFRAVATKH